ncbi:hypothetical protein [Cohnella faecalis]|uniref:hypothetical protein n=1 Tax=Cohnella faecalis TaxID=2315694 RepID=UPI0011C22631|nr:hypothetical protein [Cohnella faecalis]
MSEMQQYYLSRVPDRNYYKFLDLLGVEKREAVSAVTEASFDGVRERLLLPRGTKLLADDQLFETADAIHLLPLAIERIVVRTEREASDMTASNTGGNTAFFAFGREAHAGSRFYVAFDQEPEVGETVTLSIRLATTGKLRLTSGRCFLLPRFHGKPTASRKLRGRHGFLSTSLATIPYICRSADGLLFG